MAKYYYFNPKSGKWKYEGEGVDIPVGTWDLNHDKIRELNGGSMPGITGHGKHFTVVIVDDELSFPRMIHSEDIIGIRLKDE